MLGSVHKEAMTFETPCGTRYCLILLNNQFSVLHVIHLYVQGFHLNHIDTSSTALTTISTCNFKTTIEYQRFRHENRTTGH